MSKSLLLAIAALIVQRAIADAGEWKVPVVQPRVCDGDTVAVFPDFPLKVRLNGIDTPEMHDERQAAAALVCRLALAWWIDQVPADKLELRSSSWDKYGGRVLGDLADSSRPDAQTACQWMLEHGYGRPYHGDKKRPWTDKELADIVAKGYPKTKEAKGK
jgi:endonuclease YncB( thermonuclease family)